MFTSRIEKLTILTMRVISDASMTRDEKRGISDFGLICIPAVFCAFGIEPGACDIPEFSEGCGGGGWNCCADASLHCGEDGPRNCPEEFWN